MKSPRQIAIGAKTLARLWIREWEVLLCSVLRAPSRPDGLAQVVVQPDEVQVTITVKGPEGEELLIERCPWSEYSRGVLERALGMATSSTRGRGTRTVLSVAQAVTGALVVPQKARSQVMTIVRDHLARKMPLKMGEVFLGCEVRTAAMGKLELRYLAVPHARINRWLTLLSIRPSELQALQGPDVGGTPPVTVPFGGAQVLQATRAQRAAAILALITILAPVAGFGVLAWRQHAALSELEGQITPLSNQVRVSTEGLKVVYGMADTLDRFSELRAGSGIVMIWEELARLLPDSTFLTGVEMKGNEVHTTGFSVSAADLISQLEKSQHLQGAAFAGPVVFDRTQSKERFSIRVTIRKPRRPPEEGD
jgi:general secretion pathway protein L